MKRVLILGAGGQIARWVIQLLSYDDTIDMTLFLRSARRLGSAAPANAHIVEGDVLDADTLTAAMSGQDVVYANLAGDVDAQASSIIEGMKDRGVGKLIFIASLGIYDKVPGRFGEWNRREIGAYLPAYRKAADLIEASELDYVILRPAWLSDRDEVDYETTDRTESFKGTEVSRKSVASLVLEFILLSGELGCQNLGINKPGTQGDRPTFLR